MNIEYLGGIAKLNPNKKLFSIKFEAFKDKHKVIEVGNVLLDVENLFLRTFDCSKENCDFYVKRKSNKSLFKLKDDSEPLFVSRSCCEGGSLEIPDELIENIDNNLEGIKKFMDKDCLEFLEESDNNWKSNITRKLRGVRSLPKDNRCIFSVVGDGMPLCALHAYALSKNEPILNYKPYECYMFPIDFIKIDDKVFLTSITDDGDNVGITRWGDCHCSQKCIRKGNGKPMYEYAKDVIVDMLGEKCYNDIDALYKSDSWR